MRDLHGCSRGDEPGFGRRYAGGCGKYLVNDAYQLFAAQVDAILCLKESYATLLNFKDGRGVTWGRYFCPT